MTSKAFLLFPVLLLTAQCPAQEASGQAVAKSGVIPSPSSKLVVGLYDVQGLWGGRMVEVFSDDHCIVSRYTKPQGAGEFHLLKYESNLPSGTSQKLLRLAGSTKFLEYRQNRKTGVPDEACPRIRIPVEGAAPFEVQKFANEKDGKFDPLYNALLQIANDTKKEKILHDGPEGNKSKKH